MKKGNKGFTLIELLVVIAIIAILSTVVMAGLNSARAKGRDAKRLSDIKQLQSALELCFDNGVGYPSETGGTILITGAASAAQLGPNTPRGTATPIFSVYMNPLPSNPLPAASTQTTYTYCSEATSGGGCAAGNVSYRMQFGLEGAAGSLVAGQRTATPSGIQ